MPASICSWLPLRSGFLHAIQLVLKLREGALVTAGPPCGSFVFLNMGTSKRTKSRPLGGNRPYVRAANKPLSEKQIVHFIICGGVVLTNGVPYPHRSQILAKDHLPSVSSAGPSDHSRGSVFDGAAIPNTYDGFPLLQMDGICVWETGDMASAPVVTGLNWYFDVFCFKLK